MKRTKRYLMLPAALISGALVLSSCGGDKKPDAAGTQTAGGTNTATRNDADVKFAQDMIVHHRGAIEMSKLAASRAANADVKALASKIEAAQQPEIDTMSGWLKTWGKDVPKADGMAGMDHGGDANTMPGMMTDKEMDDLEKASGAAFDTMFLDMMIKHHEGAITMSNDEQTKGADPAAKELAGKIITDQTAEIATMRELLNSV